MEDSSASESEIKSWLQAVLEEEKLKNLSVTLLDTLEKGSGYMSDVVFVCASGIDEKGSKKEYDLVLKCSKRSEALRNLPSVKEAVLNELHMYSTVLPAFTQFQIDKGIEDPFDSVPKCYGIFTAENLEVLVLENLKTMNYFLLDPKRPSPRNYVDMVISQYAKFHAISVAMKDQQPDKFQEVTSFLKNLSDSMEHSRDFHNLLKVIVDEICDLLKDDINENTISKWKSLKEQVKLILQDIHENVSGPQVVAHGDGWNNNFMYRCEDNDISAPSKVAILDWQLSRVCSPVLDLSYFLFTSIAEEDLQTLNLILEKYYESFASYLKRLGSNPDSLWPFDQFINDWKNYSKCGILMAPLIIKLCCSDKNEAVDMEKSADQGKDVSQMFTYEINDKNNFKKRIISIVEYVVEHNLI